jgi:hypothetical protein
LRHRALLFVIGLGCGYPEFRFVDASVAADSGKPIEDAAPDTIEPAIDTGGDAAPDVTTEVEPPTPASCRVIHERNPGEKNGTFTIDPDGSGPIAPFAVFCEMTADGGGWTLALKVDGSKTTFAYDAAIWTNDDTLNETSTNTDLIEAKMRSFSTVPFNQLRIGMSESGTKRFTVVDVTRASLRDAFSVGRISTTAGRDAWLKLVASPVLQANCNDEGLNIEHTGGIAPRVRIGIIGNEQADCATPDSYIGIGGEHTKTPTCFGAGAPPVVSGNLSRMACGSDADRTTITFAYVFVR